MSAHLLCGGRVLLKGTAADSSAPFYGDLTSWKRRGLMASLKQEFLDALEDFVPPASSRKVTLATGVAAHPFLDTLLDELRQRCHNLTCNVVPIVNDFFGDTITVAGLVTGGDLLKQLPKLVQRHARHGYVWRHGWYGYVRLVILGPVVLKPNL